MDEETRIADPKAEHKALMQQIEDVVALARESDPERDACFIPVCEAMVGINRRVCEILGIEVTDLP